MSKSSRLGRPPASNSAETRARIIDVGRRLFAENGYGATSNRALAEAAGLTTGAIYHYFDRKLDIYTAVYEETQTVVYGRLNTAIEGCETFIESLHLVLETSHQMDNENPSLAHFLGSCRVDASRDESLADALRDFVSPDQESFFRKLVELGVSTGEIDPDVTSQVETLLHILTTGMINGVSGRQAKHRLAVDGAMALFEGKLIRPPVN